MQVLEWGSAPWFQKAFTGGKIGGCGGKGKDFGPPPMFDPKGKGKDMGKGFGKDFGPPMGKGLGKDFGGLKGPWCAKDMPDRRFGPQGGRESPGRRQRPGGKGEGFGGGRGRRDDRAGNAETPPLAPQAKPEEKEEEDEELELEKVQQEINFGDI